jgi:hypothetical protein
VSISVNLNTANIIGFTFLTFLNVYLGYTGPSIDISITLFICEIILYFAIIVGNIHPLISGSTSDGKIVSTLSGASLLSFLIFKDAGAVPYVIAGAFSGLGLIWSAWRFRLQ